MTALVDEQMARPRFYLLLLSLFAGLAVVLAAVGVYGVVAYVVTQRTREIGVRMALGAKTRQVVGLMLWQGLRPAVIGMLLGLSIAAAAGRVIQGLLYEVQPHDPVTLVAVTGVSSQWSSSPVGFRRAGRAGWHRLRLCAGSIAIRERRSVRAPRVRLR